MKSDLLSSSDRTGCPVQIGFAVQSTPDFAVDVTFIVDPLLFRRAGIGQVPALAWLRGGKEEPLVVCGDARIGYLLEVLEREAGN